MQNHPYPISGDFQHCIPIKRRTSGPTARRSKDCREYSTYTHSSTGDGCNTYTIVKQAVSHQKDKWPVKL